MYKRDIINFLFIISFPIYGIGTYISAISSPSVGYVISISPHLIILIFFILQVLYKSKYNEKLNRYYLLMILFILYSAASLFISYSKGLPESSFIISGVKSILLIVPFHAFIVVVLYNEERGKLLKLLLISLSLLIIVNLIGYFGLGLSNATHSLDGRLNFPFVGGIYSGAGVLAIINLIIFYYIRKNWTAPLRITMLSLFFSFNMVLFLLINSRLTILVFILVLAFSLLGLIRIRGLYLLSMFTIPILLATGLFVYRILQLPLLSSMMQRVDIEDVTTFNGRAFLWEDGMNWLIKDREGFIWGNGYQGHYFIGLIDDVAKMWNEENIFNMHLHSTSMEILVCQGVVFFLVFALILYRIYKYFKQLHYEKSIEGGFFLIVIFILFIMQIDSFVYLGSIGYVIFSLLVAMIALTKKEGNTTTNSLINQQVISKNQHSKTFEVLQKEWA